ncbi:MAG: hypothetical protein EZS28_032538 [Streblomastix strix]|uniref:Uncharacterized protein n=1 Tax=Streblomastix strix TaxID=222440 RepID=A0A5J4UQ72_9EUKA|nr:MAG: hypothetical protein EZS28_032538 [Streblomastix strix]
MKEITEQYLGKNVANADDKDDKDDSGEETDDENDKRKKQKGKGLMSGIDGHDRKAIEDAVADAKDCLKRIEMIMRLNQRKLRRE